MDTTKKFLDKELEKLLSLHLLSIGEVETLFIEAQIKLGSFLIYFKTKN